MKLCLLKLPKRLVTQAVFGLIFGVAGISALIISHAATTSVAAEVENGWLSGCTSKVSDANASGGSAVQFGACGNTGGGSAPAAEAGAHLPITYNLASLTGPLYYVAQNGSDANPGTVNAPFATLGKAISAAAPGATIVIRGGTYHEGKLTVPANKTLKIIAYPGETPVFSGSQSASSGWTAEGNYYYHAYTSLPVTDASGISFSTGQNLNGDGVGKYPDQVWVGSTALQQVTAKTSLGTGKFWAGGGRVYIAAPDYAKGNIELSDITSFIVINAPSTTIEGLRIARYSSLASDYGVVRFMPTADNGVLRDDEITDDAFGAVFVIGDNDLNTGTLLANITIDHSNYFGVQTNYTDNFTMDGVKIEYDNQFNEFSSSPESGALKTSRTRHTKVLNSLISNNNGQGIWFDQSNSDVQVANNTITNNSGSGVFFEISDNLLLINNYISASGGARAVKLSASSGLKLVNNTIVGGADPVGVYVDNRSIPGCANPANAVCAGAYSSDRDTVRPYDPKIDWIPRIDYMVNNIVAYPTAAGYCGGTTALCITDSNQNAHVAINTVIHKADSLGRPQTYMNGNVYANGSGSVVNTSVGNYTTVGSFAAAMAGSPVGIGGLETASLSGNNYVNADGSPTAALAALQANAVALPNDSGINQYLPAGTRHFGVTYR